MRIYELHALDTADIEVLLRRALEREPGAATVDDEAVAFLADRSGGDARTALGALEIALETADHVTIEVAEEALQRRALRYDKGGDQHYDYISAWIKATRASDPDAALYYLAVMLEGGEDPRFLARRMVILASEDIGGADPTALTVATATADAVEHVGMPECVFALSQCTIHLALAPKSNAATRAIAAARDHVRRYGAQPPPAYLRDAHYGGAAALGRGQGYRYPHDEPDGLSSQDVMPEEVGDVRFYDPRDREPALRARLEEVRKGRGQGLGVVAHEADEAVALAQLGGLRVVEAQQPAVPRDRDDRFRGADLREPPRVVRGDLALADVEARCRRRAGPRAPRPRAARWC